MTHARQASRRGNISGLPVRVDGRHAVLPHADKRFMMSMPQPMVTQAYITRCRRSATPINTIFPRKYLYIYYFRDGFTHDNTTLNFAGGDNDVTLPAHYHFAAISLYSSSSVSEVQLF